MSVRESGHRCRTAWPGSRPASTSRISQGHRGLRVAAPTRPARRDSACAARSWPSPMLPALHTLLDGADGDVHVVASGDPLLHGIGNTLIRLYGPDRVAVLPHVSSVTLACSRVGWAVQDTEVISLVTAEPHTAVRRGGQAVVMSRDALQSGRAGATADRQRPRRLRDHRARTTRRARGAAPVGHRPGVGGAAAGRRRSTSTSSPCATCPTSACLRYCPTIRSPTTASSPSSRCARSRWPRWRHAPASCCGTSARDRAASRSSGAAAGPVARCGVRA